MYILTGLSCTYKCTSTFLLDFFHKGVNVHSQQALWCMVVHIHSQTFSQIIPASVVVHVLSHRRLHTSMHVHVLIRSFQAAFSQQPIVQAQAAVWSSASSTVSHMLDSAQCYQRNAAVWPGSIPSPPSVCGLSRRWARGCCRWGWLAVLKGVV